MTKIKLSKFDKVHFKINLLIYEVNWWIFSHNNTLEIIQNYLFFQKLNIFFGGTIEIYDFPLLKWMEKEPGGEVHIDGIM